MKYSYEINEEIARWVTEVYIRTQRSKDWWVAFTNPIAGPWKKITALNGEGVPIEIYRFEREGERPDLILVNDKYKLIIIIEAKDFYQKLVAGDQMEKSVRVIAEVSKILEDCKNEHWGERSTYRIVPSFLWFAPDPKKILEEDSKVRSAFEKSSGMNKDDLLNIVITKDPSSGELFNNFVYKGKVNKDLVI
jgi:hypothetical protein